MPIYYEGGLETRPLSLCAPCKFRETAMALRFEWDSRKALINRRKHGITFEEASTIFDDSLSITIPDPAHSAGEDRFITIGTSVKNRLIVVVHTDRYDNIRIVSARKPTGNEKRQYEQ
jgi:uncharacterized protein